MDHKTVSEILKKYHVINDIVYNRVDNSRVTDEDIITESLLAWYLNEEAGRKHRTMVDELHNSRLPGANRGITLNSELSIPDNDTLIDSLISDYRIDGTINDSPNNVAIREILESENHIEIEETLINPSFLARPDRRLGIAALRYIARKNGIDIDINSIKITIKYDAENKKNIVDVSYTKKPIEKKAEEEQAPVIPPVLDPAPEPVSPLPSMSDTSVDEPQMTTDSLINPDSNPITESTTPFDEQLEPATEPQLDSVKEDQDLVDVDAWVADDLQDQPKEIDATAQAEEPAIEPKTDNNDQPGFWEKLRAGFKAAKDAAVGVGNKIGESVIDAVETHKEKKRNAKLDAQMPIEEVERMIQEAEAMGDIDSKKYWTNILCQKQGLPLQYPELIEQQRLAKVDSEIEHIKEVLDAAITSDDQEKASKLKETLENTEAKKQQLTKLNSDIEYIKGLLDNALASDDEITASRMEAVLKEIEGQKNTILEELELLVDIDRVQDENSTLEPPIDSTPTQEVDPTVGTESTITQEVNQPEDDATHVVQESGPSVPPQEEGENITIDFVIDELKTAINNKDREDLESLISLTRLFFPYASTLRYLDKIDAAFSQDAIDNALAMVDILKITLPGFEAELDKYEKSQTVDGNITL